MKKILIFDFDGTLCDSFPEFIKNYQVLAPKFWLNPLSLDQLDDLRNHSTPEALRQMGLVWWKLPFFIRAMQKKMRGNISALSACKGMKETLDNLTELNCPMGILTSNSESNVRQFLTEQGLERHFQFVVGGVGMFKKAKMLKRTVSEYQRKFPDFQPIYVGDETRDYDACLKARVPFLGVSWGYNSAIALKNGGVSWIVDRPSNFLAVLEKVVGSKS